MPALEAYQFLTKSMVDLWSGLIRRAHDAKRDFNTRGAQVEAFYSGGAGFMWNDNYISRFLGGAPGFSPPKFKITFAKAFEFVAVMGPMLFWQLADRKVRPYESMHLDPAVLAGPDPRYNQLLDALAQQQAMEDARHQMRAQVQERILNWLPREQPSGGLTAHADLAVFEALLKGAGFLLTHPYKFPGSDRTMVGSYRISCDDVLVDPDCRSPLWDDAGWIAIRHGSKWWELERYFELPPGTLKPYATKSSAAAKAYADSRELSPLQRAKSQGKDIVEWYEVYSRSGVGSRIGVGGKSAPEVPQEFDDVAGDFVYLCICPSCPYPLNLPSGMLAHPAEEEGDPGTDEWLRAQLAWPTEYWRDNKWPVSMLSFYPHSADSPWPEPPLSPAIGELTVLNIFISSYVQTVYDNSQQLIAVFEGNATKVKEVLSVSKSPAVVEMNKGIDKSINDVIQFMKRPEVNSDVPRVMDFILKLIERRVMPDMLYGEGGGEANSRSATEYQGRMQSVNIRPDYMRKRVAAWMTEVAEKELFAVYTHMTTEDVAPQLGPFGAMVWEQLVVNEDPEVVLRSSDCYIEASQLARPTKERDAEMLQQLNQYLSPILAGHGAQTGDWRPFNGFLKAFGAAANIDVADFLLPEQQGGDPEAEAAMQQAQQEIQQQSQQLEMARQQAEVSKVQAEAQRAAAEAQAVAAKLQIAMQDSETKRMAAVGRGQAAAQEQQFRLTKAVQDAGLKRQAAEHAAVLKQQQAEHAMQLKERDAELRGAIAEHGAALKERDAEARAEVVDAQAAAKSHAMQMSQAMQAQQLAANQQRQMQDANQRASAARQQLLFDLLAKHQQMQHSAESHRLQLGVDAQRAAQEAQRSNMITQNRLLMDAAKADMRRTRSQGE